MSNRAYGFVQNRANSIQWISVGLIVVALLVIAEALPIRGVMTAFGDWLGTLGFWGPIAFGIIYVVATVLFVPGSILSLAGGAVFELWVGLIAVSLASTTGAMLAFLIARYFAREKVAAMARKNPKFDAIDQAIGEGGWKIVALLRLSPAVPYNVQNYLYGLTPIGFWPCLLATAVAMLPGTFLYVYAGHVAGTAVAAERERTAGEWALLVAGLIATAVVTIYIAKLARGKLQEQTALERVPVAGTQGPVSQGGEAGARPGAAVVSAMIAIALLGGAVYVQFNRDLLQKWILGLFGPPAVQMAEAYRPASDGPTFDHSAYGQLLEKYVNARGGVDYEGLRQAEAKLNSYIAAISKAPFDAMGRNEKLALLIDAYNAFTLRLVLDFWPLASIRDIPASQRWEARRWNVGSHIWSLNEIEHEQIRPKFVEPRIHFALVCAAVGCPPLRREAYTADRLDEQLQEQVQYVHGHDRWFQFEPDRPGVVHLTPLYRWYRGDFEQVADSMLDYAARYAPDLRKIVERGPAPDIRWLEYDWSLNSQENLP